MYRATQRAELASGNVRDQKRGRKDGERDCNDGVGRGRVEEMAYLKGTRFQPRLCIAYDQGKRRTDCQKHESIHPCEAVCPVEKVCKRGMQ